MSKQGSRGVCRRTASGIAAEAASLHSTGIIQLGLVFADRYACNARCIRSSGTALEHAPFTRWSQFCARYSPVQPARARAMAVTPFAKLIQVHVNPFYDELSFFIAPLLEWADPVRERSPAVTALNNHTCPQDLHKIGTTGNTCFLSKALLSYSGNSNTTFSTIKSWLKQREQYTLLRSCNHASTLSS